MKALPKKIALLGGSFDPPHLGHQLLALSVLALEPIDALWILPCADHPFGKSLAPFSHRLNMCKIAFGRLNPQVSVLPLESELPVPSFTVQTLRALKQQDPSLDIHLIIGSDLLNDLSKWKEPEEITKLCKIIVFLREGLIPNPLPKETEHLRIHRGYILPDVRSSHVRKSLNSVDLQVQQYIQANSLYN